MAIYHEEIYALKLIAFGILTNNKQNRNILNKNKRLFAIIYCQKKAKIPKSCSQNVLNLILYNGTILADIKNILSKKGVIKNGNVRCSKIMFYKLCRI